MILHREITGQVMSENNEVYIESYNYCGMSSGIVSGCFWLKEAIPLLIKGTEKYVMK